MLFESHARPSRRPSPVVAHDGTTFHKVLICVNLRASRTSSGVIAEIF